MNVKRSTIIKLELSEDEAARLRGVINHVDWGGDNQIFYDLATKLDELLPDYNVIFNWDEYRQELMEVTQ